MTVRPSSVGDLVLRDVGVRAGRTQILQGVGAELRPGELCALIGPSGAGKSTLIKVLLGLRKLQKGAVSLGGRPVRDAGPVGYVPQDDALHRQLTVVQALRYAAALRLPGLDGEAREARVQEVMGQVGLEERSRLRIRRLSGGQRKRVSVALELMTEPPVLILDEPTSGLDPGMESHMMHLFRDLARTGRIAMVATHAMQSLEVCDALWVLVAGRLVYCGPPQGALGFFGAASYAEVFAKIPGKPAEQWERAYRGSGMGARFASRPRPRLTAGPRASPRPSAPQRRPTERARSTASPASAVAAEPSGRRQSAAEQLAAMKSRQGRGDG